MCVFSLLSRLQLYVLSMIHQHINKPCLEIHSLEILLFVYLWSTMHKKGTEMKMDVQSKQIQYADRDLLVS